MLFSARHLWMFIILALIAIKLRARKCDPIPVVCVPEDVNIKLMDEVLYYARALGIDDSTTIQVRFSLRLPPDKKGLVQYQNTGFEKERHQIMIWINRRITRSELSMTLAHEMVHAVQYISGELKLKNQQALWHNESFNISRVRYEDRSWEKQAQNKAYKLRSDFLIAFRGKEKFPSSIHPFPESL